MRTNAKKSEHRMSTPKRLYKSPALTFIGKEMEVQRELMISSRSKGIEPEQGCFIKFIKIAS